MEWAEKRSFAPLPRCKETGHGAQGRRAEEGKGLAHDRAITTELPLVCGPFRSFEKVFFSNTYWS